MIKIGLKISELLCPTNWRSCLPCFQHKNCGVQARVMPINTSGVIVKKSNMKRFFKEKNIRKGIFKRENVIN
jgi:hypothetical protein